MLQMLYYYITRQVSPFFTIMQRSNTLDKFAILLSGVCLLHCLLTPVLVTLLPIFSLSALVEDVLFHKLMLWIVLPSSFTALFIGCRKHKRWSIAASGLLGMLILVIVAFFGHEVLSIKTEKIATTVGGLVLALSHYLNYRACQATTCKSANCATQHHH